MKRNHWILLGATSLLIASLAPQTYGRDTLNHLSANTETIVTQKQATAKASGKFVAGEKPAKGTATIVREGGHSFLQFDAAFSTSDQGPDLHVLLDTTGNPPKNYQGATMNRVVNLGQLKSFTGAQRYPIPDGINLANYKSVVIWCRMANATFAHASMK